MALALGLRLWNLHFGLPEWYHPDEILKARAVARIALGDPSPGSLYHPSFMRYAAAVMLRLRHPSGVGIDEQRAVRAGRLVVALLGTATVALTFLAGTRASGAAVGLVAALVLAIAPLHVVSSHYFKEDVPLTFWAMATFLASLRIARRGTARDVTIAAFLAGVATGTKYTGVLFIALPWMAQQQRGGGHARRIVVAAACGFLLTTPFAVIDLPALLLGVGHGGGNALTGMAGISVWPFAYFWTYHLRFSILPGVGVLPVVLALVGAVVALRRRSTIDRLLLATVTLLYLVFETSPYKPPPNADRQVVPLLPFVALLAAMGWQAAATAMQDRRLAIALLAVIPCGPLLSSVRLTAAMRPDTRAAAAEWLRANACGTARIVLEGALNADGTIVPSYVPLLPTQCNAIYVYSLERERSALESADLAVASSFMYDRFLRLLPASSPIRQFYEGFFTAHPLVAEFRPRDRSYGFHNPTVRIYALNQEALCGDCESVGIINARSDRQRWRALLRNARQCGSTALHLPESARRGTGAQSPIRATRVRAATHTRNLPRCHRGD